MRHPLRTMEAITGESLFAAWKEMLATAYVRIIIMAPLPSGLLKALREKIRQYRKARYTRLRYK